MTKITTSGNDRTQEIRQVLKDLPIRHQILEACLIVEECIDQLLTQCFMRGIEKTDLYSRTKKSSLSLDQKICLVEVYVETNFLKFPRMLQRLRNKVVHDKKYDVTHNETKKLFKELAPKDKEILNKILQKLLNDKNTCFQQLNSTNQLLLLTVWFVKISEKTLSEGPFILAKEIQPHPKTSA